jgi:hypothetical protein
MVRLPRKGVETGISPDTTLRHESCFFYGLPYFISISAHRKTQDSMMDAPIPTPMPRSEAEARQAAYAARRRAWAECVGRPYEQETDPRPPPGKLDAGPDE